ncbi:ribosome hibernation-promoting factor, HPF/YfiA family [Mobilicoccus massiliensis]|uniref:ribosome hibernation-promoting factor, HPF/YfiA family n=1 Tax=Mobilicoccus massiliensis TaxID=1522310 RepID=UPI00058C3530|nr:ribosome-associated translation inhibitor RaiA [Mobilicoccus massiliensis]
MEIIVTGRQIKVSDRFREVLEDKLAKVEQLAPRTQRVEVVLSHETTRGAPKGSERLEITCLAKGPVVRAEAYSEDKYTALDLALAKLTERLRRVGDRRKVSRRRGGPDLQTAVAGLEIAEMGGPEPQAPEESPAPAGDVSHRIPAQGDSPIGVREKIHASAPMTLEQALSEMELVGHDFYLFHDIDTDHPSVVYRRRGWDYGVIHLEVSHEQQEAQAV